MTQHDLGKALKGLYAGGVTFLGMLSTILVGNETVSDVTQGQWVTMLLFSLTAIGGAFGLAGWSGPRINGASKDGP